MYDLIVIGAGVEGMAAAVAGFEKKLKVLVAAKSEVKTNLKESMLGIFDIKLLVEKFLNLAKEKSIEFMNRTEVISLEKNIVSFSVEIKNGSVLYAKTIIIAAGGGVGNFDHLTQKNTAEKIKITESVKTSVPGIYAVGEAAGTESFSLISRIGDAVRAVDLIVLNKKAIDK